MGTGRRGNGKRGKKRNIVKNPERRRKGEGRNMMNREVCREGVKRKQGKCFCKQSSFNSLYSVIS